jgi:hypothetical protein
MRRSGAQETRSDRTGMAQVGTRFLRRRAAAERPLTGKESFVRTWRR